MSPRELLEMHLRAFGERPMVRFMLNHGKDYALGPNSFAGRVTSRTSATGTPPCSPSTKTP